MENDSGARRGGRRESDGALGRPTVEPDTAANLEETAAVVLPHEAALAEDRDTTDALLGSVTGRSEWSRVVRRVPPQLIDETLTIQEFQTRSDSSGVATGSVTIRAAGKATPVRDRADGVPSTFLGDRSVMVTGDAVRWSQTNNVPEEQQVVAGGEPSASTALAERGDSSPPIVDASENSSHLATAITADGPAKRRAPTAKGSMVMKFGDSNNSKHQQTDTLESLYEVFIVPSKDAQPRRRLVQMRIVGFTAL
ncbi:hypothetical protein PHYPSEUDO_007118 [Phytophthora pseudosyringae]|uniref:Uncharacterized protein n=1 Tax=Phytophthora pseudosyringae TaxID=221518 RepID=A0A8T1WBD7_9STRA|nr:hypothetical protein PHYPSEUDO_007118 [Phytophthora pseudosyringae]